MKTARLLAAACLSLSLTSAPVLSQDAVTDPAYVPETAADLLGLIKGCEDDVCMSYVSGAIGGIAFYSVVAEKSFPFCTDDTVQTADIRDAIVSTIETTPQLKEEHPALAIMTAFGRHWPCPTADETFQATSVDPVNQDMVEALLTSGGHALTFGDVDATSDKTILVFHDANCSHCVRFKDETAELASRGWKVVVYPVATIAEDSAGYGAVEIALRDTAPDVARALYDHKPEGLADITLANQLAEDAGMSSRDILTAIAKSGAYAVIEENTRRFFEMGAEGTPSWIVGSNLYGGFLTADGIETLVSRVETTVPAPSPQHQSEPTGMEQ